jgi:hypothetical protein
LINPFLDFSRPPGASWQLNIKKLGVDDATIYIYKADSIAGIISADGNPLFPVQEAHFNKVKEIAEITLDSPELPAYRG